MQIVPLLLLASTAIPKLSHAFTDNTPALLCNGCQTQQDFNSYTASSIGSTYGTFEYLTINPNSVVIYDVTVEATFEEGRRRVLATSTLAGPDAAAAFNFWWPYFGPQAAKGLAQLVAEAPPSGGEGVDSFGASTQEAVCTAFTGTPGYVKMHQEMNQGGFWSTLERAFTQLRGRGPTGVFIFANGDVATYEIYPDDPGISACKYVKGSARDAQGLYINDRGLGGNGSSNGSNYVRPGNGQFFVLTQSYTIACSYVEDGDGKIVVSGCTIELP
jgi:hypothetical protein